MATEQLAERRLRGRAIEIRRRGKLEEKMRHEGYEEAKKGGRDREGWKRDGFEEER